jgi:S1-C subfamily serine protease
VTSPLLILGLLVASGASSHAVKSDPSQERAPRVSTVDISANATTDRVVIQANGANLTVEQKTVNGASVTSVTESSPAGFWPFQRNDIIVRINTKQISRPSDILFVWRTGAPSIFEFEVIRNGTRLVYRGIAVDFFGLGLSPTPEPPVLLFML